MQQQINIEEQSTTYDVSYTYHSDMKCENYDVSIMGIEFPNGKVTIKPSNTFFPDSGFMFIESDPDRAIAIAQMIIAFAHMVKNNNQKSLDTDANA